MTKERVGYIEVINYQVQSFSERLDITNCHHIQNLKVCILSVNDHDSNSSTVSKFDTRTTSTSTTATVDNLFIDTLLKSITDEW
jgi:hypothetical protein